MANNRSPADTRGVRWLVLIVLLASTSTAFARFVVEEERGMFYACPKGKTWKHVETCLKKHGRIAVVKQIAGAKLVRFEQLEDTKWVEAGVFLYAEHLGEWKAAGAYFGRGIEYELLDFKAITIGKHTGYRIDIGQATPLSVQLDGLTTQVATRRAYQTMFCSPLSHYCAQAIQSCEVLVRGHAYWTFRGAMKINGNEVTVAGDRRIAGPFCVQAEKMFLGWPQT